MLQVCRSGLSVQTYLDFGILVGFAVNVCGGGRCSNSVLNGEATCLEDEESLVK